MISNVLDSFLNGIRQSLTSDDKRVALDEAQRVLNEEGTRHACNRCEHAQWSAAWGPVGSFDDFSFTLTACGGGAILQQNEGSHGLQKPYQKPHDLQKNATFFCSAESQSQSGGGSGGKSPSMTSRGGRGSAETDSWPRQRAG